MSFNPDRFEQQGQGGRESDDEDDSTDNESSQSGADLERQFLSDGERDQLRRNIEQSDADVLDQIGPGRETLTPREGQSGGAPDANAGEEDIDVDRDLDTGSGQNSITPRLGTSGGTTPSDAGEDLVDNTSRQSQQQTSRPEEGAFDDGLDVDPGTITTDETGQSTTQSGSGSTEAATESQTGGTVDVPEDPVRTDESFEPDPQTGQETARAPRGPDGDVESPTEAARRRDRERGDIGDLVIQNPVTGNRIEEDLESASQDFSDATTFKDVPGPAGNFLSGASQAVNVPEIALGGKELLEGAVFAGRNIDKPGEVFDVAVGETVSAGSRTSEAAQENPARTAGALSGGIITGTATTRAASRASIPSGSRRSASTLRSGERGQANFPDQETIEIEKTVQRDRSQTESSDTFDTDQFDSTDELLRETKRDIARERTPPREEFGDTDEFRRAVERRTERIDEDEVIQTIARRRSSQQLPDPSEFDSPDEFVREFDLTTQRFEDRLRNRRSDAESDVDSVASGAGSGDGNGILGDLFTSRRSSEGIIESTAASGGATGAAISTFAESDGNSSIFGSPTGEEETTTEGEQVTDTTQGQPTDDGEIFDVGTDTETTEGVGTAGDGTIFQPPGTGTTIDTTTGGDTTETTEPTQPPVVDIPTDTDTDVIEPTLTTTETTTTQPQDTDTDTDTPGPGQITDTKNTDSDDRRRRNPFFNPEDEDEGVFPPDGALFSDINFGSGIADVDLEDL